MDMRMNVELLTPRGNTPEEANLRAETFRIACHFEKSFRTKYGTGGRRGHFCSVATVGANRWGSEDHVQIAGREKFSGRRAAIQRSLCSDLTLRAVAIAAAVIRDGGTIPATGALIEMTAECGSTAIAERPAAL